MEPSESAKNDAKRFYVGNLFHDVTEQDLQKLFVKYGNVANVEIKNREDIDGNKIATYAFVTLNLKNKNDNAASQCIRDCNNLKWKKNVIKVQVAQDSFLSRLQRERQSTLNCKTEKDSFKERNIREDIPHVSVQNDDDSKRDKSTNNHQDKLQCDSRFQKKASVAKENGIIDFPSDEDSESFQQNNNKKSNANANSRKVYHSSSDEEPDNVKQKKVKPVSYKNTTKIMKEIEHNETKPSIQKVENKQMVAVDNRTSKISPISKPAKQRKKYYSSSSDEEDSPSISKNKRQKTLALKTKLESNINSNKTANFLNKLESFDSFWQDDQSYSEMTDPISEPIGLKAYGEQKIAVDNLPNTVKKSLRRDEESIEQPIQKSKKGKAILDQLKNKDSDDNEQASLSNNMLRFDPSDEKHKKYDLENSSKKQVDEDNAIVKDETENMCQEEGDKKFWMSSHFANDLTAKMKRENSNQSQKNSKPSSFSFNFDSAASSIGNSYVDEKTNDKDKFANNSKPKSKILQDDSSDDESIIPSNENGQEQDKVAQKLKQNYKNLNSSEKFGLKLKEKAVHASVINSSDSKLSHVKLETFFFTPNDKRLEEGLSFIRNTESMDILRTKFEEKRPILAEILRKKMRNKVKKHEKNSFGGSLRRLKNKRNSFKKKFRRNVKK